MGKEKRKLSIPSGDASVVLQELSVELKMQIVYPTHLLDGIKLRGLKGRFTVVEAVNRLLRAHSLVCVEDEGTGVLIVKTKEAVDAEKAAKKASAQVLKPEVVQQEKRSNAISRVLGNIASSVSSALPELSEDDDRFGEGVFELSPFTVDASQDNGYRAQSSLAGTRSNSRLRDIAASLTSYTDELLEDLGANNFEELSGYAPNMEVDNFDSFAPYTFVVRGVPAQRTRNFFALDDLFFRTDFYSTERVESARGPNAILFGIAKPGGVLNVNTKRAHTTHDSSTLKYRVDTWGSNRFTADFNKVILDDKLALRFNWLDGDETSWRGKTERSKDKRFHIATTFIPAKQSTFRLEWEHVKQDFNRPPTWHTRDHVTAYLSDAAATRIRNLNNEPVLDWNRGILYDAEDMLESVGTELVDFTFQTGVPKDAVLMGASPGREGEFDLVMGTWEQRIGKHLSFEVTHYDLQSDRRRLGWNAAINDGGGVRIDAEPTLSDGSDNPNFGKYFVDSSGIYQNIIRDQKNTRGTAIYDLDLRDRNLPLGKHSLTAYYEVHRYKHHESSYQEFIYDYDTSTPELDLLLAGMPRDSQNRIQTRVYFDDLSDSNSLAWADDVFDSIRGVDSLSSVMHPGREFSFLNDDGLTTTAQTAWLSRSSTSKRTQGRDLDSLMAAWKGIFMEGGRLILTCGYREDETGFFRTRSLLDENGYVLNELDPIYDMTPSGFNPDGTKARLPATKRRGISRTKSALFRISDNLTLAYNTSSTNGLNDEFRLLFPNADVPDLFNGSTEEISARFSFFEGSLQSSLTYYTLDSEGEVYRASLVDGRANDIWRNLELVGGMIEGEPVVFENVRVLADYSTTDRRSKGIEFATTANLGRNFSFYYTFSKNDTKVSNLGSSFYDYFGSIDPSDTTERTLIGGVVDQWKEAYGNLLDGPDPVGNPSSEDLAKDRFFNGDANTSGSLARFENDFFNQVTAFRDVVPLRQSKYKSAVRLKYRFREGLLSGTEASVGARYNSGRVIASAEEGGSLRSADEVYVDTGVRHRREFFGGRAEITFSVNIRNLLNEDDAIATAANADGAVTNFRFMVPRQTRFETSVTF